LCREEEKMSATFGDPLHETEAAKAEGASVVVATAVAVKAVAWQVEAKVAAPVATAAVDTAEAV
jgi:hypothetical protein